MISGSPPEASTAPSISSMVIWMMPEETTSSGSPTRYSSTEGVYPVTTVQEDTYPSTRMYWPLYLAGSLRTSDTVQAEASFPDESDSEAVWLTAALSEAGADGLGFPDFAAAGIISLASRTIMEPKIVQKEAFSAVGCEIQPKNGEQVDVLASGAYWSGADCGSYAKIHEGGTGKGEIGAWMHPDGVSGELRYFFGAVSDGDAPEGFVKLDVPAARYAVFDVPPVSGDIHGGEALAREVRKTWKHIFKEWMDRSAWRFDERGMCFEFYRGKTTQIFVPVKAKE